MDEASGRSVLLLEDLTALRPGDNLAGCSLDDATLAVRRLARFTGGRVETAKEYLAWIW